MEEEVNYLPAVIRPREYDHVTESEAEAIWLEAKKPNVRLFVKVLWFTGLRISEVLRLTDADLKRDGLLFWIRITRSKKRKAKPKFIPIQRQLGLDISDYLQASGIKGKLFPGHENTYRYQIKQCALRAKLTNWREIHPHSFRHGFIYNKAMKGIHPFTLNRLVEHESLQMTLGYFKPTDDDLREAMEQ